MEDCENLEETEGQELDFEDEVEELQNSLREVVQDPSVRPRLQCLLVDPSFSMVTVQSEDSGILWETASSRCSTPWASETSSTSEAYSMDGSGTAGNITIVFDEEKILRRRTRSGGRSSRLGDRLSRPGSSRSASALGVERPEMMEVSLPNIKQQQSSTEADLEELKSKDQQLFSLISDGYEILNIRVPSKLATVDEEESTELQDNLSYLNQTPNIKSRKGYDASQPADPEDVAEETLPLKPNTEDELCRASTLKESSSSDIDYFEKFTLLDEAVPGEQLPEQQKEPQPPEDRTPTEEPSQEDLKDNSHVTEEPFVFVTDVEIVGEHLDEVFYGGVPPADILLQQQEMLEEARMRTRRESERSTKENGSVLFGSEETILTPIFISPGPPKIIDPILLEEPPAMSFMYADLYEDAIGDRRKTGDEERSEAGSVASERAYRRRSPDPEEAEGYLEKFTLKDETPVIDDPPEREEEPSGVRMMWPQSMFEKTGCLTRMVTEEQEEKTIQEARFMDKGEDWFPIGDHQEDPELTVMEGSTEDQSNIKPLKTDQDNLCDTHQEEYVTEREGKKEQQQHEEENMFEKKHKPAELLPGGPAPVEVLTECDGAVHTVVVTETSNGEDTQTEVQIDLQEVKGEELKEETTAGKFPKCLPGALTTDEETEVDREETRKAEGQADLQPQVTEQDGGEHGSMMKEDMVLSVQDVVSDDHDFILLVPKGQAVEMDIKAAMIDESLTSQDEIESKIQAGEGECKIEEEPDVLEKEPVVLEKEPVVLEKEPVVLEKEPHVLKKEPHVLEKEPVVLEKEPDVLKKEPVVLEKKPHVLKKEPDVLEKEPVVLEKEPHFLKKEQVVFEKEPVVLEKEPEVLKKEPDIFEMEPDVLEKEPDVLAKEPVVLEKEPEVLKKEPDIFEMEPVVLEKEPVVLEKEPVVLEKEPVVLEKEPVVLEKEPEVLIKEPDIFEMEPDVLDNGAEVLGKELDIFEMELGILEKELHVLKKEPHIFEREPEVLESEPVLKSESEPYENKQEVIENEPDIFEVEPEILQSEPVLKSEPVVLEDEPEVLENRKEVLENKQEVLENKQEVLEQEEAIHEFELECQTSEDPEPRREDLQELIHDETVVHCSLRSFTPLENLSELQEYDVKPPEEEEEPKMEDSPEAERITDAKEVYLQTEQEEDESSEDAINEMGYEVIDEREAQETMEPGTRRDTKEMEPSERTTRNQEEEVIEAEYDIIDEEEEREARLAVELQGLDWFCVTCGCLMSEEENNSQQHHGHHKTSVDQSYQDIKETLSVWISELQERTENIEDLVSELELAYNSVEEQCVESEAALLTQNEEVLALVMEQYNHMSVHTEEEKKAKLEQLYDQIVSFQESLDAAKASLERSSREEETDARTPEDIQGRLKAALVSASSLDLGPKGLLVFQDYAKANSTTSNLTQRKGISVPQRPSLRPQEPGSASSTSVSVYWEVNPGDVIDCFQVYCMEEPQGAVSEEYRVTVKESCCLLEELQPDAGYRVWVMAVNYSGCSLPSDRLLFNTAPAVPVILTERCAVLWDSATLRWSGSAPPNPGHTYTLEYCRQHQLEGEGLRSVSGIRRCEQQVFLQPNDSFLFYVKAVNQAGVSDQSEAALISTRGTRFQLLRGGAHPWLEVCEDGRKLSCSQEAPTAAASDQQCPSILGDLLPSRGVHYWETLVSRCAAYRVGVASSSANRSVPLGEDRLSWCLRCAPTPLGCRFQLLHGAELQSSVCVVTSCACVGTLLDFQRGRLSFYDAPRRQLIASFQRPPTAPCHPALALELPGSLELSTGSLELSTGSLELRTGVDTPDFTKDC